MSTLASLPFRFPGIDAVACAFTTRRPPGSNGAADSGNLAFNGRNVRETVQSERESLKRHLGFASWREVRQVHGTEMVFESDASAPARSEPPRADALATDKPGLGLAIKVADCQPVLLAHRSGRYIAALHVGWRANRAQAPALWTERFCGHFSLDPKDVLAVRGPSLGPGRSEFINFDAEWGPEFVDYFDRRTKCLNLWRLTRDQLIRAGLKAEHIFALDLCTYSLPELFFSYRRDRDHGRQAGLIWIHAG